jgi:aspartyl-tRNA synthetase
MIENEYRTHLCGQLRQSHAGQDVRLSGWIHRKRNHGGVLFIDLRDHDGLTQCVVNEDNPHFDTFEKARVESVITVDGTVVKRSADTINPDLKTGEIEVTVTDVDIQSPADVLPLQVNSDQDTSEELRLTYRFLDLRRKKMQRNIRLRSDVIASLRRRMIEQGFHEFQTPILTASSPEGARDFLVPARQHPGKFYALPQAPQQFKQLLMVSGFDRYFQIAPCFRDEDSRADRSPGEFYQLDFEMAFVTQEDVFAALEPVLHGVFDEFSDFTGTQKSLNKPPFPRIPYDEAMLKYGTDKPDLRNPLEIQDVSDIFVRDDVEFRAFRSIIESGGVVRTIVAPQVMDQPRRFFDELNNWAQDLGAPGLGYILFEQADDGTITGKGPIAKFLSEQALQALMDETGAANGDATFFVCDQPAQASEMAGKARTEIAERLDLIDPDVFHFCWIVDFPMYEADRETGDIDFSHNPFSMPQGGMEALEKKDPLEIKAFQYDIVCNGIELSSGAIRNHRPDIMVKAFEIAGYDESVLEEKFSGMLNAFRYGAPPHGGSAPGIDRIVMMLADEPNIREVITFPLNQRAEDLMMGAPAEADAEHLKELHIKLDLPAEEETSDNPTGGQGEKAA